MKTVSKTALLIIGLVLAGAVLTPLYGSGGPGLNLDLAGAWEIRLGDDLDWARPRDDGDQGWEPFTLPGNLAGYSRQKTGHVIGRAWVRKTFHVPDNWAGQRLGLVLGRIAHTDETYLNGSFIGGEGDIRSWDQSMWYKTRFYEIPSDLIRAGEDNVLCVRVQFHTMGEFLGPLKIVDHGTWLKEKTMVNFLRIEVSYIIVAMSIPFMIIFFLFYLERPRSREYFYYSLQIICGLPIVLDLCFLWDLPNGIALRFKLVSYGWVSMVAVHAMFLHALFRFKRYTIQMAFSGLLLVMLPLIFFTGEPWIRYTATTVLFASFVVGTYIFFCYATAIRRKQPLARVYGLLGMVVIFCATHDGFIQISRLFYFAPNVLGYRFDYMIFPFGAAIMYTGTAIILAFHFVELKKKNEDLRHNLEKKVTQRTRSLIHMTEELEQQNVTLKNMALRDSLTGLYNHASFCDRLEEIFMTARENRIPMAVAMIDVDDFKGFNDTYGHQAGDQVLIAIASILKHSLREYDYLEKFHHDGDNGNRHYDLAGRYGGDEFMMVLPGCDETTAFKVTERICEQIHAIRIDAHPDLTVSGSFGLAVLNPGTPCQDSDKLTALADEALYRSKSLGKNRVYCKVYERG